MGLWRSMLPLPNKNIQIDDTESEVTGLLCVLSSIGLEMLHNLQGEKCSKV